ncbi:Ig-like domain-containing protein [Mesobacillus jeotgali]|uniref:Ig-like domain-containing protein n=1 Tax=Mesobacillus jeotgali TaxID=129985 RepID=A0ABY9VNU4_9BACI|nr:Ig-like domain-containing protein [Mesobacillus jeotgali]WNF22651.1 Ig-like domain-containing protein [Mesobacillus jeotgali]
MKKNNRVLSTTIALLLFFLPVTAAYGEGQSQSNDTTKLVDTLRAENTPKLEEGQGQSFSYDPADYPLVSEGSHAGTLKDQFNAEHRITYLTTAENTDPGKMEIQLTYESDEPVYKDALLTIEFFTQTENILSILGAVDFDTYGETGLHLSSILNKDFFADQQYIFMRLGVSADYDDPYYSDTLLFKVANPFYKPSMDDPNKFVLVSNESVDGDLTQYTGQFKMNNFKFSFDRNLSEEAYKVDAKKPFDLSMNKDKKVNAFSKLSTYQIGQTKDFWVYNFETGADYQLNATLMYSGAKTNVWVNKNQITSQEAESIGREFDQKIHPAVTDNFAAESDVDSNGKINILTYDIQDGYQDSGAYIGGYFNPGDLFDIPYSNKTEIFYIDTYPAMDADFQRDVTKSFTTLAHEFQHMVNFNQTVFIEGSEKQMDVWLDEALAMAAEQVYSGRVLSDRIDYYNYSSSIANGHSLLYWDYDGDVLANYALSYLFGQYVKIQSNIGDPVFNEILTDKNNDYLAVENVIKKYIDPTMSFGKFMTNFRTALLLKKSSGLHGFKGITEFNQLKPKLYSGTSKNLRGGGAVVKPVSSQDELTIPVDKESDISYLFIDLNETGETDLTPPAVPVVYPVSDKDLAVKGTAEPGSAVHVYNGSSLVSHTFANNTDGSFTASLTAAQKAGTILTIRSVDKAGNISEATQVTVLDKTAPAAPIVNQVRDYDKKINGKSEAGSRIAVKSGSVVIGNATVDQYGNYSVTLKSAQKAGTKLSVTAADKAGNISGTTIVTVLDKTAPVNTIVNEVRDYDKKIIGKAEPSSKITIKSGKKVLGYAITSKYGNFSVTLRAAQKAGTILSVTAADKAGNVSKPIQVTVKDKTPPAMAKVNELRDFDKKITGKAEAYSKIIVKSGKNILGYANADKYGKFTLKFKKSLKAGTALTVSARDKSGNVSKPAYIKVKDKTAPKNPIVNKVTYRSTSVSGKTELYATIFIKSGNKVIGSAKASRTGIYKIKIAKQKAGKILYAYAKDPSGNVSKGTKIVVKR